MIRRSKSSEKDCLGVSTVIGAVLLFGILVVAFSSYQAVSVPNQNEDTEFSHFQEFENDMVSLHVALHQSADSVGRDRVRNSYTDLKLGTQYKERVLAVNPVPVYGELNSSSSYNVTVEFTDGTTETVETRFLRYQPNYNYLPDSPVRYENSLMYRTDDQGDFEPSPIAVLDSYTMLQDNELTVVAIQTENDYNKQGLNTESLEIRPDKSVNKFSKEISEVRVPTKLGSATWSDKTDEAFSDFEEGTDVNYIVYNPEYVEVLSVGIDHNAENSVIAGSQVDDSDDSNNNNNNNETSGLSIDNFQLSDSSNPQFTRIDVDWEVSDADGGLSEVTVELENGIDSQTTQISGNTASGSDRLEDSSNSQTTYEVTITVTDQSGNSISETKQINIG